MIINKSDIGQYNPKIITILDEAEWNDIMITYCIYNKEHTDEFLKKLEDQGVPVPHWGYKN